jgi:hypothetical protein
MPTIVSTDPTERMGVYTRLADVPPAHRLDQHAPAYDSCETWQAYVASRPATFDSDHYQDTLRKAGESWKTHMEARGRHHALARPADVAAWVDDLAATRTLRTVYSEYWVRVEEFYTWLQFHTRHPHVYHPPLMAVVAGGTTARVWAVKFPPTQRDAAAAAHRDAPEREQR